MRTVDYLDALRARLSVDSDAKVAAALGLTRSAASQYRARGVTFDDSVALKVAGILGIEPETVLADMHAERAKDPAVRQAWERIARRERARRGVRKPADPGASAT